MTAGRTARVARPPGRDRPDRGAEVRHRKGPRRVQGRPGEGSGSPAAQAIGRSLGRDHRSAGTAGARSIHRVVHRHHRRTAQQGRRPLAGRRFERRAAAVPDQSAGLSAPVYRAAALVARVTDIA